MYKRNLLLITFLCLCDIVDVRLFSVWAECKCAPLDLAFIVDSSESIGTTNFALAKDFIITVIDRLAKDQQVKVSAPQSQSECCGLLLWRASVALVFVSCVLWCLSKLMPKNILRAVCKLCPRGIEKPPENRKCEWETLSPRWLSSSTSVIRQGGWDAEMLTGGKHTSTPKPKHWVTTQMLFFPVCSQWVQGECRPVQWLQSARGCAAGNQHRYNHRL